MKKISLADLIIKIILGVAAVLCIIPFYNTVLLSLSKAGDLTNQRVLLFPQHVTFASYSYLLSEGKAVKGFFVTLAVTFLGTLLNMLATTAGAYTLSKKSLPGRNLIFNLIIFTMFFNGGLVPYFLTIQKLNLTNNILVMIIPVAINTFYLILMKNFFNTIPAELEESAKIDGANDILILFRIVLPVSLPILAAVSLFYAVDRWNEWYMAMIFINDTNLYPLQLVLRETIQNTSIMFTNGAEQALKARTIYVDSVKAAIIVISAVPILLVYPFLQKYFSAGIMIGSIKG
jgi:putative aldouronate transport system permease protein